MKVVRFTQRYGCYNPGETAGFPETEAANLLKLGVATDRPAPQAEAPPTARPDPPKGGKPKGGKK